jgi:hypothetical protein
MKKKRTLLDILKDSEKDNILDYMIWDDKGKPLVPTASEFLRMNSHKTNEENLIEYAKLYAREFLNSHQNKSV